MCAQLTRDLLTITKFLVAFFVEKIVLGSTSESSVVREIRKVDASYEIYHDRFTSEREFN